MTPSHPEGIDSHDAEPPPDRRPAESDLVYDWNQAPRIDPESRWIELDDETLRDGLQSPSVKTPSIEDKLEIVHMMHDLGIDGADIGLPGAGQHVFDDVLRITREIVDHKLSVTPNCAARTVVSDCEPIVEISQQAGIAGGGGGVHRLQPDPPVRRGVGRRSSVRLTHDACRTAPRTACR